MTATTGRANYYGLISQLPAQSWPPIYLWLYNTYFVVLKDCGASDKRKGRRGTKETSLRWGALDEELEAAVRHIQTILLHSHLRSCCSVWRKVKAINQKAKSNILFLICACVYMNTCVFKWRPKDNSAGAVHLLFFEITPFIDLELTKQARLASWPVSPRNAPVSTSPVLRFQAPATTPNL